MSESSTDRLICASAARSRIVFSVLLLLLLSLTAFSQSSPTPKLSDFAGTWKANLRQRTWLVLKLEHTGGTLRGTLTHALQIVANDDGDITEASEEMTESKITGVALEDGVLVITAEDSEGLTDQYEMTLAGPDSAELRSSAGEGSGSARKPIKITRATGQ